MWGETWYSVPKWASGVAGPMLENEIFLRCCGYIVKDVAVQGHGRFTGSSFLSQGLSRLNSGLRRMWSGHQKGLRGTRKKV
jgi:hypothetical protein